MFTFSLVLLLTSFLCFWSSFPRTKSCLHVRLSLKHIIFVSSSLPRSLLAILNTFSKEPRFRAHRLATPPAVSCIYTPAERIFDTVHGISTDLVTVANC
jgi:hypothetical protein